MKCALIGPVYPYRGGIAHYTTLLSQALQRHNVDLLLISFARQYPQWLFPGRTDRDPSATPFATTAAHYWIDSLNPFTWLFSFARIRRYRPDLIILQWWTLFWFPIWWCLLWLNRMFLGAPVLWICHNVLPHEPSWLDRFAARALLRFGCRVIVHSAAEAETLHRLLPHLSYTIVEMPAFPIFGKAIDRSTARDRLKLSTNHRVLLFFGIVRPYKGLSDLLQAMSLICHAMRDEIDGKCQGDAAPVTLLIAGEFWQKQKTEILAQIAALGLPTGAVIIDDRYIPDEEVSTYFAAADLLVAPYRQVTGSAVIQSALQWGLPIVTTTIVRDTLPAAQAQTIVGWAAPNDPAALAAAVVDALTETVTVVDNSAAALDFAAVIANSWDHIVDVVQRTVYRPGLAE